MKPLPVELRCPRSRERLTLRAHVVANGDLFDRLGAPVEDRDMRAGAAGLLEAAALRGMAVGNDRGWMVAARKPAPAMMEASPDVEPRA